MTVISRVLLVFLSLIGMADAAYITYEEFAGVVPKCLPLAGFDCGLVLQSEWSHIGPIPLSLLGVGFYATVFLLASYALVATKPHPWTRTLLAFLGTSGFLFSLYLFYIQAVVLKAFCVYCLVSAFTSTAIFVTSLWHRHLTRSNT
jgi:uncharacterized membrane protein